MKCMHCNKPVPIYFNVLLCDDCCDKQIAAATLPHWKVKLEAIHKSLGETHLDGFQSAGILSVAELEKMWNA